MAWTKAARDAAALARKTASTTTSGLAKTGRINERQKSRSKLTIQTAQAVLGKRGYRLAVNPYNMATKTASYSVTAPNGKTVKMSPAMLALMVKRKK